jgi:YidC/Oxa1 family membrane protein insertase
MGLWAAFVDLIYAGLFVLSVVFGGNMGVAIVVLSLSFRLALLPLTLRMAYRSLEVQAALRKLEPELSTIRKKYKDNPRRVWEETAKLHQRHGIKVVEGRSVFGMLVQLPLFLGLFAAVRRGLSGSGRFLWISDLTKPDALLAAACAALTGLSAALGPHSTEQQRTAVAVLPAVLTFLFLWRMAAGVTIYTVSSGLIGLVQSFLVRRRSLQTI